MTQSPFTSDYSVVIFEREDRQGIFVALCRETGISVTSRDPEHDICDRLTTMGYRDGSVEFWRDGKLTLTHSSIYKMGARRIALGAKFPYDRPKREEFDSSRRAALAGGRDGQP